MTTQFVISQGATRRTFLRGLGGATLALPWLEGLALAAPSATPPLRMAHYYVPIGVVRRAFFPGEADHVIPKGNLGDLMQSLGEQDPHSGFENFVASGGKLEK